MIDIFFENCGAYCLGPRESAYKFTKENFLVIYRIEIATDDNKSVSGFPLGIEIV